MNLASTTAPFTLDPTLPWLRTDPTMQRQEAFINHRFVQLNEKGYAPMGLYFPGGTYLLAERVTKLADLTPGLYWHEHTLAHGAPFGRPTGSTICSFGRFEGFGELTRSQARRHKQGRAHFSLGCDTLECDLFAHQLRQDGTTECFINFGTPFSDSVYKLWRITHYVTMPAEALALLGEAAAGEGLTEDQRRWTREERLLRTVDCCSEYSACPTGGFPGADYRAILQDEENRDFSALLGSLPRLTPSQAKKRKSGVVTIAWRSYDYQGFPIGCTYHLKQEDARPLLDLLQSRAELDRATARATAATSALAEAASRVRSAAMAERRELVEAALKQVAEEQTVQLVAEPSHELALAA